MSTQNKIQPQPAVLRINDAAQVLGIGVTTLRRFAAAGRLRIVKIGPRAAGVLRSDIDRFLAEISQS